MSDEQSRVLTRARLFASIWETPITRLAKEYGISDVGLAKICRRMEIPRPPRGYWQQLEAGRAPARPHLRPLSKDGVDSVVIRRRPERDNSLPDVAAPEPVRVPDMLGGPHRLTNKTLHALEKGKTDERGLVIPRSKTCLHIRVARENIERACLVMDTLIKVLEERGYAVKVAGDGSVQTQVEVEGESFGIGIEEKVQRSKHVVTEAEREKQRRYYTYPPLYDYDATGLLSLTIYNARYGCRTRWQDGKRQQIEDCLGAFIQGLEIAAQREKEWRAEQERWRRKWEEQQRLDEERRRLERLEKLRAEKLMADVAAWAQARRIRTYIGDVTRLEKSVPGLAEWIAWARSYADAIDPLQRPEELVFRVQPSALYTLPH